MKIESLNCPNCGAAVSSDAPQCQFCRSRLKTQACPACLGLMFLGSQHCPRCGAKSVEPQIITEENLGACPRCKVKLNRLRIDEITLRECRKCGGYWTDVVTFETVCADRESRAAVLGLISTAHQAAKNKKPAKVSYIPCPDCRQLMNRSNFANSSGVIIDLCKQHGVWFDAEEFPKIIEFVRQGGLDHARNKEKIQLEDERNRLRQQKFALERNAFRAPNDNWDSESSIGISAFIRLLFD